LKHLESLINSNTRAIIVNNPSNPCGSVYSKEHLISILAIADKHHIPIIADEIYGGIVFEGTFHQIASLTKTVPVLTVGGLAKLYVAPGWRIGWVILHDRNNLLHEVQIGLVKLSQLILGANTLCQSIIEEALFNTPKSYYDGLLNTLKENAQCVKHHLSTVPGLKVISPGGAMYMMVGLQENQFKGIKDDVEFSSKLLEEEMVFVLPGTIFKLQHFIRLVICAPKEKLEEACLRIVEFCKRYNKD